MLTRVPVGSALVQEVCTVERKDVQGRIIDRIDVLVRRRHASLARDHCPDPPSPHFAALRAHASPPTTACTSPGWAAMSTAPQVRHARLFLARPDRMFTLRMCTPRRGCEGLLRRGRQQVHRSRCDSMQVRLHALESGHLHVKVVRPTVRASSCLGHTHRGLTRHVLSARPVRLTSRPSTRAPSRKRRATRPRTSGTR